MLIISIHFGHDASVVVAECLQALRDKRVDHVATTAGLYKVKNG